MSLQALLTPPGSPTTPTAFTHYTMASHSEATGLCVFPISPTLLALHRLLYYLSLLLSLLYPTPPPLIEGAFAYSLTTSSIAAVYATILSMPPSRAVTQPQSLDELANWAILSSAAISLPMFLTWNKNLRHGSSARTIVRIWGLLIFAGTICAFLKLKDFHFIYKILKSRAGWQRFENLRECKAHGSPGSFDAPPKLRNREHVQVIRPEFVATQAAVRVWRVTPVLTFIPLANGTLACLFTIHIKSKDEGALNGPEFQISDKLLDNRWSRVSGILRSVYVLIMTVVVWASPIIWVVVLVLNEMFLLQKGELALPRAEELYEVGQWGIWAGLGLVVAAGSIDAFTGKKRLKKFLTREDIPDEGRTDYGGIGTEV